MRHIDKIIVHCSDSDHGSHDNYESIYKWHVEERKFADIGYHFLITKNGKITKCRPVVKTGAHCFGQNKSSIGICLTGKREFSQDQFITLRKLVKELHWYFGKLDVYGHRDFKNTACPGRYFDMKQFRYEL